MEYSAEYKKCIHDPIYFMEHYVIVNGKHITLTSYQKKFILNLQKNIMISAKEANKRTVEAIENNKILQERLKEKYYIETLDKIEKHIKKQIEKGYSFVDLKTGWMQPNVERIIKELRSNGYEVTLYPANITSEYIFIKW